ncbi:ADP-ribose pyrophosphatase YjhB (NUDIX family) [Pseudonocardia hierapolitana]|uniref:ADP-ribose pyrophosphatase YjhB (NUDIX family) n=1 Tax=Pseudonocardia hierapolitana TaxID=1128676 RepID=A0A561SYU6_9PSEU|nr:NUDIX domain-containing protein [Pseudonocardia hierapolitana]TWF80039.1 ADP-ribose pyrophosphatase YjhB (NUDIX family) [Pseudonocardia hierapolitana]
MTGRRIDYFDDPDAPRPTRIVPGVAVAVVNEAGQLLMIRRTDNDQWSIPGGKQEVGETPIEAGRREVREETGILCEVTGLVGIFSSPRNVIEYTSNGEVRQEFSILFAGRPVGGEIATSSESQEVEWCDRNSVLKLSMTPAQRRRIRYFLEFTGEPYLE